MIARILPQPFLTLFLAVAWVLLLNNITVGGFAFGLVLGVAVPLFTKRFWPTVPRLRHPVKIVAYILLVMWDIVVANVQVASWILFRKPESLRPRFITVPIDLKTPEAIAVLAGTITMTPGTVSSDIAADGRSLLVHGLNIPDDAAAVADIKARYEARLKEIFE